ASVYHDLLYRSRLSYPSPPHICTLVHSTTLPVLWLDVHYVLDETQNYYRRTSVQILVVILGLLLVEAFGHTEQTTNTICHFHYYLNLLIIHYNYCCSFSHPLSS